jgi:hypothetical protein
MWKRIMIVLLALACAAPLFARGRARGYHAGAGVHRPTVRKKNAAKQTKKAPPAPQPSASNF